MTTIKADTWQAHRLEDVDAIRAGILDIIDHGRETSHTSRSPSRREQDATYRTGDMGDTGTRFHYGPTPRSPGRSSGRSDPTGKAAVAREQAIQQAVTDLSSTVSALTGMLDVAAPDELVTRKVPATYTRPARTVVDADPAMCRIHVLEVSEWLCEVVGEVADSWRAGWVQDATLVDRAERVKTLLAGLRRRVAPDRPAQPTLVFCRHHPDKLAKYRGRELCGACYEQERRAS